MVLHDREVRMAFPVGAMQDVAKLCPDNDIRKIGELFDLSDESKAFDFALVVKLASILSYWGEEQYAFYHAGYEARPFTEHELNLLSVEDINALFSEVMNAMTEGNKTTVQTESADPKKE